MKPNDWKRIMRLGQTSRAHQRRRGISPRVPNSRGTTIYHKRAALFYSEAENNAESIEVAIEIGLPEKAADNVWPYNDLIIEGWSKVLTEVHKVHSSRQTRLQKFTALHRTTVNLLKD